MKMYTALIRGIFAFAVFGVVAVAATLPQDHADPTHAAAAQKARTQSHCVSATSARNELNCPAIAPAMARTDLHTTVLPVVRVVPDPR